VLRKRRKWAGTMAQVVEHLPSKLKVLSSNPSTEKKKKKEEKEKKKENVESK
jgi:hypothetical protein